MAAPDDDIERLLREVEASLNPPTTPVPTGQGAPAPARRTGGSAADQGSGSGTGGGAIARVRDGIPVAVAVGAVSGAVVWVVFTIVPFVSGVSGGLGAFVGAAGVSLAGRLRRR